MKISAISFVTSIIIRTFAAENKQDALISLL